MEECLLFLLLDFDSLLDEFDEDAVIAEIPLLGQRFDFFRDSWREGHASANVFCFGLRSDALRGWHCGTSLHQFGAHFTCSTDGTKYGTRPGRRPWGMDLTFIVAEARNRIQLDSLCMAWLWTSWQEYVDAVHPAAFDSPGRLRGTQRDSWFEVDCHLWEAVHKLTAATQALSDLGFTGSDHDSPPDDTSVIEQAERLVLEAIYYGEELLLYHKRLAKSDAAYGFLHQNDMLKHWNRYQSAGRIPMEIHQLISDIRKLLNGYHEFVQAEDRFIVGGIDLPPSLESDFRLARNLFSVGFDEVGLLMAGRGLEGVLRKIADVRKISLDVRGKMSPASEADVYDLIEAMSRLRWKTSGTRFITPQIKALLHFLRSLRNSAAHASGHRRHAAISPRETATVIAETANRLWNEISRTRARLAPPTIQKTW
jgi:hypothetical protein